MAGENPYFRVRKLTLRIRFSTFPDRKIRGFPDLLRLPVPLHLNRKQVADRMVRAMGIQAWEDDARETLARLKDEIGCDACALGLLAGAERELKWRLASGNGNERYLSIAERVGGGLSGSVVKVGRAMSLQLAELLAARRIHEYPILLAEGMRSAYAVPLVVGRDVVGVLLAGDRRRRIYRAEERSVVAAAAERIAATLAGRPEENASRLGDMVE